VQLDLVLAEPAAIVAGGDPEGTGRGGGLHAAVKRMRLLMEEARMQASGRRSA